jgi:hypothetical protein
MPSINAVEAQSISDADTIATAVVGVQADTAQSALRALAALWSQTTGYVLEADGDAENVDAAEAVLSRVALLVGAALAGLFAESDGVGLHDAREAVVLAVGEGV